MNLWKYIEGSYTYAVLEEFTSLLSSLWLYALAGIAVTALLSLFLPRQKLVGILKRKSGLSIFTASLLGVISPLPTYTVIPLAAALFSLGVPAAPLMAFLVASPLMNPSLFSLTAGAMGLSMACARLLSALILGVLTGLTIRFFELSRFRRVLFSASDEILLPRKTNEGEPDWFGEKAGTERNLKVFSRQLTSIGRFTGKYLFVALLVASLVKVFFPGEWVSRLVGRNQSWAILIAAGCGIPLYTCGGASIPVVRVLLQMGMDKGAALAFFIAGPATKLSTIWTLNAVFRKKIVLFYLLITVGGAVILGNLYRLW